VIACIEDPVVIKKILMHLEEKSPSRAALLLPDSRAPRYRQTLVKSRDYCLCWPVICYTPRVRKLGYSVFVKLKKHTRMFLALFLLFMQQVQLAHAADLVNHPDSESCEACLVSTGFDQGLTGAVSLVPVLAATSLYFTTLDQKYYQQFLAPWHARGPPE